MKKNIQFRDMFSEEAETLLKIGKQYFSPIEQMGMPIPQRALVATVDGNIAGALFYKVFEEKSTSQIAYIDLAYIVKEYRGIGIGELLYHTGIQNIKEKGCKMITAMVVDDNVASWKLFEKGCHCSYLVSFSQYLGDGILFSLIKQSIAGGF